jgi:hypothetical protein
MTGDENWERIVMDMTYWKATRTDGTDFYTGTVDYAAALASGEPLPELSGDVGFPGPGWYHLATVPTECVGMSWPCRLFEVGPADDLGDHRPRGAYKVGATSVRVLREIDAHVALGPQGVQVAAFIEKSATLTADDVRRLGAAWDTIWGATPGATWDTIWGAAWDATRATRGAAWGAAREAAWEAAWGAATRDAAWSAAWGVARGLLLRDLIGQRPGWDQGAYDLLTGPWRDAIGPIHPDDGDGDE